MTKDKSTGVDSFSSDESKARSIVLMLILRMRRARALWKKLRFRSNGGYEAQLYCEYIEAANAAELARRILYGREL